MTKKKIQFCLWTLALMLSASGCSGLLTRTASPTSIPVTSGIATTNQLAVVADLNEARSLNAALNPTPSAPLVDAGLGALAALLTALSGWYVRHTTAVRQQTIDAATAPNPNKPLT